MSDSETRPTSLDRLRARARKRVECTNLQAVARAVGMSPKALENFLSGAPIRSASRRKLFTWLMESDLEADERVARCVRMMKEVVSDLPEAAHLGTVLRMLDVLRVHCEAEIGTVPLWLARAIEKVDTYRSDEEIGACMAVGIVADAEEHAG